MDIKRPTRVEPVIATEANSISSANDTVPNNISSESSSSSISVQKKESTQAKPEPGPRSNTFNIAAAAASHPKMKVLRVTGTGSKLEQLLTAGTDRDRRSSSRRDSADSYSNSGAASATTPTVSTASGSNNGADLNLPSPGGSGDGGTSCLSASTSTAVPAENTQYRNPRKRLLLNSLNSAGEDKAKTQDEAEKAKKVMKWKSDISSRGESSTSTNGPASLKVAPIRLKKYYPSAVQSAECEEFLVSLSEDNAHNDYEGEGCSDLAGGGVAGEGPNPDALDAKVGQGKSKSDQTGIDTDQIEKLLAGSMPSQNNWKKTPKRQRKHQCSQCWKSYSSEDDLKSHELSHSKGTNAKLFECELCDKTFKWVASRKVHYKSVHGIQEGDKNGEESGEENPEERKVFAIKKKAGVAEICPDIAASNGTAAAGSIEKQESIGGRHRVRQIGQVVEARQSKKVALEVIPAAMKKSVTSAEVKIKPKKVAPAPSPVSTKKQVAVAVEPETPPTPTPGRTALRRTIQRPKWLTDTDLVTNYNTNSLRMGSTTSSPSTASSVSSSSSTKTVKSDTRRNSSVEVSKEKQSGSGTSGTESSKKDKQSSVTESSKKDKQHVVDSTRKEKQSPVSNSPLKSGKSPISRPSRERIRKAKTRPKMERTITGGEAAKEVKAGTEEVVSTIAKSSPNTRQREKGNAEAISPTKQLQAKILNLSLSTIAESSAASKNAITRKRPSADTGTVGSQSKATDKKARKSDVNSNSESEPQGESKVAATTKQTSHSGVVQSESGDAKSVNKSRPDRSSRKCVNHDLMSKPPHEFQGVYCRSKVSFPPIKLAEKEPGRDRVASCISGNIESFVTSDSKKTVDTEGGVVEQERKNSGDANAHGKYSHSQHSENSDGIVGGLNEGTVENQMEGLDDASQLTSPFLNCDGVSFADIAGSGKTKEENHDQEQVEIKVKEEDETDGNQVQNTQPLELSAVENGEEDIGEADSAAKTSVVEKSMAELPSTPASTNTNDEEMPVLKPETNSATVLENASRARAGPRSPSDKSKSLDDHEEESSNSNHSANPLEAPVLSSSDEFGTTAKHSSVAEDENKMSNSSRALINELSDTAAELDKLPLMEDEDNVIRRRRDRSDSLSVRSCGSGSPSEKLRALDDTNTITSTKDREANVFMDNEKECLDEEEEEEEDDSDSDTDTLFSELSELAAQVSEKTDAVQFKEDCMRFIEKKVSANSMWAIRKELKRLKKEKKYFRFGKLSPLAAGLMHDIFCQTLD